MSHAWIWFLVHQLHLQQRWPQRPGNLLAIGFPLCLGSGPACGPIHMVNQLRMCQRSHRQPVEALTVCPPVPVPLSSLHQGAAKMLTSHNARVPVNSYAAALRFLTSPAHIDLRTSYCFEVSSTLCAPGFRFLLCLSNCTSCKSHFLY